MATSVERMYSWEIITNTARLAPSGDYVPIIKSPGGEGADRNLISIDSLVTAGVTAGISALAAAEVTFGTVKLADEPIASMADVTVVGALVIADAAGAATTTSTQTAVTALQEKLDALIGEFNDLKNQFIVEEE